MKKDTVEKGYISFKLIEEQLSTLPYPAASNFLDSVECVFCFHPQWKFVEVRLRKLIYEKEENKYKCILDALQIVHPSTNIYPQSGAAVNVNCQQTNPVFGLNPNSMNREQLLMLLPEKK